MDKHTAYILLTSLLDRLRGDARVEKPRFLGLVSEDEREALEFLARDFGTSLSSSASQLHVPSGQEELELAGSQNIHSAVTPQPEPPRKESPDEVAPGADPVETEAPKTSGMAAKHEEAQPPEAKFGALPVAAHVPVCETAFGLSGPRDPDVVLCIDFGTAKSKAFAASINEGEKPLELGLGIKDDDVDGAVYAVSSSVWIEDDGLMFAGSEAFRRGEMRASGGPDRNRLDSLKQELSQAAPDDKIGLRLLPKDVNPTAETLSVDEVITFYLAYLTDLAVSDLGERHGKSRYIKRRFTLPCWEANKRNRAARLLSSRLACAQVLADTFHGRWKEGIHIKEVKHVFRRVVERADELSYLLDRGQNLGDRYSIEWGGLLEPLAAGSARIWADRPQRQLMMVLDVGAGTCDFSLFWIDQNFAAKGHIAFPVVPCGHAIRQAGDTLDAVLVAELLDRANLGADEGLRRRIRSALYLKGVRRLKERLFLTGSLQAHLENDEEVSISLEEFLGTDRVSRFTINLESALQEFITAVHETWKMPLESVGLVLTGGGCELPMVKGLKKKGWPFNGETVRFHLVDPIPAYIRNSFGEDFIKEYPQLAVALGGALPRVLDERATLREWPGATPAPGPLEIFQVTGI